MTDMYGTSLSSTDPDNEEDFSQYSESFNDMQWIFDYDDKFEQDNSPTMRYITRYLADLPNRDKEKELAKRAKQVEEYKNHFITKSTLHGLHHCFDKTHPVRRIMWSCLLLACLGLFVQKLYESMKHFYSHPFTTSTTIKYEDRMQFPAVSFCNLNDIRSSVMAGTRLDFILKNNGDLSLSGDEYRNTIRRANHKLHDMLYGCKILGQKCSVDDFIEFNNDQGDRCFTFNHGMNGQRILFFNKTGPSHALELTINIEEYEYYVQNDYSGIRLIVHGQDETPVKLAGEVLTPGFISYVELKKKKIKNLPPPYKSKCGSKNLKYFNERYSKHLCWLEMLTDHVTSECGCKEWFMPGPHDVCSLNRSKSCMWPKWVEFDKQMKYDCPLPCIMDSYTPSLSLSQFLIDNEAEKIVASLNFTGTKQQKIQQVRNTFLKAVIYYGELSYEYMEQMPSYDAIVLLGDIGGQLGLFLGSSVLTYLEFFDCLAMVIYTKYFNRYRGKHI
eukprot:gene5606-6296_t